MNIKLIGVTPNLFKIKQENDNIIYMTLPNIYSPFGLENFNNNYIVNFTLNPKIPNHSELFDVINNFEQKINQLETIYFNDIPIDLTSKKFISSIKKSEKYNPLLRSILKKNNNMITTKILSPSHTFLDIKKNTKYSGQLILDSIWITDKQFGITIYIDEIFIYT